MRIEPKSEWLTHVDDKERVYLPAALIRYIAWKPGTLVRVRVDDSRIVTERVELKTKRGKQP
jgi:bifunctional DNA-binding transcriptional regulator/antitoxin component of YhaV-PrlF toxin-antitoxin module